MTRLHIDKIENIPGDKLRISGHSPLSNEKWTLECPRAGFEKWMQGTLIQKALPDLTPDERELLMTGYTKEDWKKMFGEED